MFSDRTGWTLSQNRFTQAQNELRAAGVTLLDLTISNPTRAGLQYNKETILNALCNSGSSDYDPQPKGLLSTRQAVAQYYRGEHATEVDPQSIALTTSTSEGYSYVLRLLCNAGDEILVPKPSYPLFEFLADLQDVTLVPYPLIYDHGWQIDVHVVKEKIKDRTRAVVLVHPNNPTGSFVTEQAELNKVCCDHDIALIVDEVFLDYPLEGRHHSFAANDAALTFTLSGLSKISGLPQMKLAWIVTSGPSHQQNTALNRLEIIADTYLSVNTPIQLAAPILLEQRKSIQPQILERLQTNLKELDRQLREHRKCQRLKVEGGWYATLRVPVTQSDENLAIGIMKKTSVLVHPGHFYDFPTDGYLVLSLLTDTKDFGEGARRILNFLE